MSALKTAHGGDNFSTWTISHTGDGYDILVSSTLETERQPNPAGWGPKTIAEEHISDPIGHQAIDRAIALAAEYENRMTA
ncbi:hypothetical protein [Leifsonia sp. Leaf264]|uniref:hypothetical protein n=1 Tax=Leifsonia sp. Leaf264 TaxID=1736314 RepID=UPI0006FBA1DA|nr:hypothetical protein [Leifsonia sp. Leaf264]KQO98575.1 hypothetical protein ASF30_10970 [Leifsonia sp. Leaf264]